MDKNTVTGMVLMAAVIFAFMYFMPKNENKQTQQAARTEQVQQAQEAQAADSLSKDEVAELDSLLTKGSLKSATVALTSSDGKISGTVNVGKEKVDFESLTKAEAKNVETHNAAIASVRSLIDKHMKNSMFSSHLSGAEQTFTLKNDSIEIEFTNKGAQIKNAKLLSYRAYHSQEDYKSKKSEIVQPIAGGNNSFGFILNTDSQAYDTRDFVFDGKKENDSTVLMTLHSSSGDATWSIRYTLVKGSYMLKVDILQKNMDKVIPANITDMGFVWNQKIRRQEVGKSFEERQSALYYKIAGESGDVDNLSESSSKSENVGERLKWFSAKSQFFSTVVIANKEFRGGSNLSSRVYKEGGNGYDTYLKNLEISSSVEYQSTKPNPTGFMFYIGPNKYKVLSSYDKFSPNEDLKLTRLVSLGWTLFRWINTGIIIPVFNWLGNFGWSYGIIILVLTILLKLVLFPLTYKSYMSQAKMRVLQPDVKAINERYPNQEDAMKKQQKTMELYRQAGASPMGGCLPMLLQMPILIAMFWFFPSSIELRGQSFLWAPDLSAPDGIIALPFSIPFLGDHLSIFCLLMTVTNITYTYLSMQSQSSSSMPGMKWMMYLMPVMFLVFFNTYAAGLSYYYFVSLLITIIQTYSCRALVSEEKVRAVMAENAKKPKKKSGFMARLEEAQRQQQKMQRERERRNRR